MKVMHMKTAEKDRHVKMEAWTEADYKHTAGILTSCRNNPNVRVNVWKGKLTS
jgi:hypothetical protein